MIKKVESKFFGESYYEVDHPTGLKIFVYPREGLKSAYAVIGTNFGSVNTRFKVDGGEEITVPDGIAHYLEHKLFESEECDAFARFAATGADANAYTSFEKTCYLFSCSDNFEESLQILLEFVQEPYFTAQTVEKEQGIIGQEIKMYDDSANWRVMFNTLVGMYKTHPVRIDIAGTVETIAEITAEKLYECYNSFYNLHNMVLAVAGNVTPEQVLKIADKTLKQNKVQKVETFFGEEPYEVDKDYVEQKFPVSIPMFNLGFKESVKDGKLDSKQYGCADVLLHTLFSSSGELYNKLQDENLINDSFGYDRMEGPGYAATIVGGESRDPKRAANIIREHIKKLKKEGVPADDFETAKRSLYGQLIRQFDSKTSMASSLLDFYFEGREYFTAAESVANATVEEANALLARLLDEENTTLSVVTGEGK
ncbi:MAG: insulinase family protein [Clostridia bacterium]|nr:insulinase family protein [Clostridia bacterium]